MGSQVDDSSRRDEPNAQSLAVIPFKKVMDCLSSNELEQAHSICKQHKFRPKLGQLLIASGRLSAGDLDSMLLVHDAQGIREVPMGKLLVIAGLLTPEELAHYFELQRLLRFPSRQQDEWARNLLTQGHLTQDQLNTILNDQQLKSISLEEAIVSRGWMTVEQLRAAHDAFLETMDQPEERADS